MTHKVIVVDDELLVRTTVKRILDMAGFQVVLAESGPECLALLRKGEHGLILMDVTMPGMSGWDTVQAVVEEGLFEGNLICMLTGKEVPDVELDALKEYVLDYIRKPFDGKQLIQLVGEYLAYLKPD
jgi:CheY-like chemotaxis protein